MTIGLTNSLRDHRSAAQLTQAELAARVSVSRKTINTIENEIFVPSTILALRLARVLGVGVEDIFTLAHDDPTRDDPPKS